MLSSLKKIAKSLLTVKHTKLQQISTKYGLSDDSLAADKGRQKKTYLKNNKYVLTVWPVMCNADLENC